MRGNTASNGGGGIVMDGLGIVTGGEVLNNVAGEYGGGIRVGPSGTLTVTGGNVQGNRALQGAGVYTNGTFNLGGGTIRGNTAEDGGGVATTGLFTMTSGAITGNTATPGQGGGVRVYGGTFTHSGGTVSGNTPKDVFPVP